MGIIPYNNLTESQKIKRDRKSFSVIGAVALGIGYAATGPISIPMTLIGATTLGLAALRGNVKKLARFGSNSPRRTTYSNPSSNSLSDLDTSPSYPLLPTFRPIERDYPYSYPSISCTESPETAISRRNPRLGSNLLRSLSEDRVIENLSKDFVQIFESSLKHGGRGASYEISHTKQFMGITYHSEKFKMEATSLGLESELLTSTVDVFSEKNNNLFPLRIKGGF